MQKWNSLYLLWLMLSLLPLKAAADSECNQYAEEMQAISQQMAQLMTDAHDGTSAAATKARSEKIKALSEKRVAAAKAWSRCAGRPTSKAEAEQFVKNRKLGTQVIPGQTVVNGEDGESNGAERLNSTPMFTMPQVQEPTYTPAPSGGAGMPAQHSGRTLEQKAAALAAVNAELERLPCILPKQADAPSQKDILKLAAAHNAGARKQFRPEELSAYSRAVNWTLRFDGESPDTPKARNYSLSVASVTNYINLPHFMIALAAAVFSLDSQSTAGANNLAAAILTAGERLYPESNQAKQQVSFRQDAERCYLYALAVSMRADAWSDDSLTALINLGYLYIDLGRLDEARSLFQTARKQSPFSWDGALGMAAYFLAVGQPDKAQAIVEDENLDRPVSLMVVKKASKPLEQSEEVPIDAPDEIYEKNIQIMNAAPIATSADFMAQIDQSERNKMRYFVEHLPVQGSFQAPPIHKLTQYASLKAISSPPGQSALADFMEMLQRYSMTFYANQAKDKIATLERLGMKINPGVDLDDMARHPEKYPDGAEDTEVEVDDTQLAANLEAWARQANVASHELASGKTGNLLELAAKVDPFFTILQIEPHAYADPMNILIQKHNFAVYNRKSNLYRGYLHSVNRRVQRALMDIVQRCSEKLVQAAKLQDDQLAQLAKQKEASQGQGSEVEWLLREHAIHVTYLNACNNFAETAFGSATNVVATSYMQKIKPNAEAYYYDVFRHVALISDPEVRLQKDKELRQAINAELVYALNLVGAAHGAFEYLDEWDCSCDLEDLLRQREAEEAAREEEENVRIERNKAAKLAFDSGEIPDSTPLFKKIDGYGFDFDYFFFKGRMSPARTVVNFNIKLPVPGAPEMFASQSISEFTGAATYGQGIKVTLGAEQGGVKAGAYFNLSSSVTTDGQGVVKDYSVTAGTGLTVSGKGNALSVGGEMTFGPNGLKDSDFSAGVSRDFKNSYGGEGKVAFEASIKHGCRFSGAVEQTLEGPGEFINEAKEKAVGKDMADMLPSTDDLFKQKQEWPGKFVK
jgi:hypothetical protein